MAASPRAIEIVVAGELERADERCAWLAVALEKRFRVPVALGHPLPIPDEWRGEDGERVDSNRVVDAMIEGETPQSADPPDRWRLAVTGSDLFAPGRRFVFGEAAQGGAWAVISVARLRGAGHTLDPEATLRRRMLKEAVHELGHLAGLEHCARPDCVMCSSADLEDTDRKSTRFCPACEHLLRDLSGVDRAGPESLA